MKEEEEEEAGSRLIGEKYRVWISQAGAQRSTLGRNSEYASMEDGKKQGMLGRERTLTLKKKEIKERPIGRGERA